MQRYIAKKRLNADSYYVYDQVARERLTCPYPTMESAELFCKVANERLRQDAISRGRVENEDVAHAEAFALNYPKPAPWSATGEEYYYKTHESYTFPHITVKRSTETIESCTACGRASYAVAGDRHHIISNGLTIAEIAMRSGNSGWISQLCVECCTSLRAQLFDFETGRI
jgi:hypothetical protein